MSAEGQEGAATPQWTEPQWIRVRHLTRFRYQGPVRDSFNEARLQPVSDFAQDCREFELFIEPAATVRDYPDFYTNCVHYFDITGVHESLTVEARSLVRTQPDLRGPAPERNPPEGLRAAEVAESVFEFLQSTGFVSLEAEVWREGKDAVPGEVTNLWEDAVRIGRHIFRSFTYAPNLTTVNTRPDEVMRLRRGVCQDFAHVMLGMCRSSGIPARYVSGYFLNTDRRPGEIEASHAWVEVFLPGYGWKGFDPTHDRVPDTRYVKVATGRDYDDIRPISGTFRGRGTREMSVEVHVESVPAPIVEGAGPSGLESGGDGRSVG